MLVLVSAETVSVVFLIIAWIWMKTRKTGLQSSKILNHVFLCGIISLGTDALSKGTCNIPLPTGFVIFINSICYISCSFNMMFYCQYCYAFLSEKRKINKWLFYIPNGLLLVANIVFVVSMIQGKIFVVENGMTVYLDDYPIFSIICQLGMMIYIPIVSIILNRSLGSKIILIVASLGVIPVAVSAFYLLGGEMNVILIINAFTIFIIFIFVQNKSVDERENDYRISLEKNKEILEKLNEQLDVAMKKAEAAYEAKSAFLFNMSHDIRTPMNAILGFSQLMEKETDNPEKIKDYLSKIESSGEYLLSIINNVLDIARIDSGEMTLNEDFTDVSDISKILKTLFSDEIKKKDITYNFEMNIEHPYVIADDVRMNQIIINLLSNAVKYTPEGGHIDVLLKELDCEKEGFATFQFNISDDGVGMSEEFQKHIFDAFTRENNTTQSKIAGTGLGMAIVKKIVDLMEGTICVESEVGKGTTFSISVTQKIVEKPEEYIRQNRYNAQTIIDLSGKNIILAEDNDLNAEITMAILEETGLHIDRVCDGIECLDVLNKAPDGYYSLILMDIQMPNLNGYEATKKIRNLMSSSKSTIPIIAMTANAFDEDRQNAFIAGMNEHVSKPIDSKLLMNTIYKFIK